MRSLLSDLTKEAGELLAVPAEPQELMHALCAVMARQIGKPVKLRLRAFPDSTKASGLTLYLEKHILVIVEERTRPEHQLIILGHELWHVKNGDCGHHGTQIAAAARRFGSEEDASWEELLKIAARSDSHADHDAKSETRAEEFGLLVGIRFRSWMVGPYARDTITEKTRAGRIASSLTSRSGPLV